MAKPWNLEALRRHLYGKGHNADDPIPRLVRSVDRSIQIFHFHAYTARDALAGTLPDGEAATAKNLFLVLGGGTDEERKQHFEARLSSEAHIVSALLMARIVWDQFAQLVDQLVGNPPLGTEQCDLKKLHKTLPPGPMALAIDSLVTSHWFAYVDGFCNTAKHRELIAQPFHVSLENNVAGVRLAKFEYRGKQFPSYAAPEVLEGAFDVKNKIVECGVILNQRIGVVE